MGIPSRFGFRPASHKTIHRQIAQRFFSGALNGMKNGWRNADDIGRPDRVFPERFPFCPELRLPFNPIAGCIKAGACPQDTFTFQDVKDLLGVVVFVQWWRFARFQDDDENLGGPGIGAVHHQVVDVSREAVTFRLRSRKDELHRRLWFGLIKRRRRLVLAPIRRLVSQNET